MTGYSSHSNILAHLNDYIMKSEEIVTTWNDASVHTHTVIHVNDQIFQHHVGISCPFIIWSSSPAKYSGAEFEKFLNEIWYVHRDRTALYYAIHFNPLTSGQQLTVYHYKAQTTLTLTWAIWVIGVGSTDAYRCGQRGWLMDYWQFSAMGWQAAYTTNINRY